MDVAMEGSGSRKKRKTLLPSSKVFYGSVDCRLACIQFLIFSCICILFMPYILSMVFFSN